MELILSIVIGLLVACGVWLILRPRTFQIIIGMSLISYAVNLFLFSSGHILQNRTPVLEDSALKILGQVTDPIPQALVLTAIVIGFATTALLLVVVMAARGFNGNDHVDGILEKKKPSGKTQFGKNKKDVSKGSAAS